MTTRTTKHAAGLLGIVALLAFGAGASATYKASTSKPATPADAPATPATPAPGAAAGHEGHGGPATPATPKMGTTEKPEIRTITGEVMDPACFLEAGPKSIGQGHYQCAIDCARSGQTLAIYDRDADRIYFIAGELPGKNPNDPVINYIHQKVDVRGAVYHRSEAWGIVIQHVTPHVDKAPASASAPAKSTGH